MRFFSQGMGGLSLSHTVCFLTEVTLAGHPSVMRHLLEPFKKWCLWTGFFHHGCVGMFRFDSSLTSNTPWNRVGWTSNRSASTQMETPFMDSVELHPQRLKKGGAKAPFFRCISCCFWRSNGWPVWPTALKTVSISTARAAIRWPRLLDPTVKPVQMITQISPSAEPLRLGQIWTVNTHVMGFVWLICLFVLLKPNEIVRLFTVKPVGLGTSVFHGFPAFFPIHPINNHYIVANDSWERIISEMLSERVLFPINCWCVNSYHDMILWFSRILLDILRFCDDFHSAWKILSWLGHGDFPPLFNRGMGLWMQAASAHPRGAHHVLDGQSQWWRPPVRRLGVSMAWRLKQNRWTTGWWFL